MSDFAAFWTALHPTAPPVAHMLRQTELRTWIRFHSLPRSKRYATSARERQIVLDRANRLATCVLGDSSSCWMILAVPYWAEDGEDSAECATLSQHRLPFQFEYPPPSEGECGYRIFAAPVTWVTGSFDEIISKRADDELPPIMWASMASGEAFAPYDGGTDLFLRSQEEVTSLRRQFSEWLSAHPAGL